MVMPFWHIEKCEWKLFEVRSWITSLPLGLSSSAKPLPLGLIVMIGARLIALRLELSSIE